MSEILDPLRAATPADLLVGFETSDDAAVYRLRDDLAVVSTADFITPVVDDPRTFGRIAAANSLSDIYAMGAKPVMALNLLGYPPVGLPNDVLGEILLGAAEVCTEADCAVGGGHSVRDDEVKFGLSVTGTVHPDRILRNCTAQPGDRLILTKPLGTGALVAAMKKNRVDADGYEALVTCMSTLNLCGADLFELGATSVTDVTGFGLTGHALEMATGSDCRLMIETSALPLLPHAVKLCGEGFTCGGTQANASFTGKGVGYGERVGEDMMGLLNDPQTSGGLLVAVPADRVVELKTAILASGTLAAAEIGSVRSHTAGEPWLEFSK
ncbi:MAG: selenide, water dikinase SelD [Gemmatimonadales bacterium]|nr:selenide, water dikinase SelD [Gemmatimonadales bacterium]